MSSSKESDLVAAVLMYATRCVVEGDQLALREMQFGEKGITSNRQLELAGSTKTSGSQNTLLENPVESASFLADHRTSSSNERARESPFSSSFSPMHHWR